MTMRDHALRARAPLGERPIAFLSEGRGGAGLVVRLVAHGDVWVGLVPASAALTERLRMGFVPSVAFLGAGGVRFTGEARVVLRGRADAVGLGGTDPFGVNDALVVEIVPTALAPEREDEEPTGACPRT